MKKIYGNKMLLSTLNSMAKWGRSPQSIIFCGEKGCGKKLFADYYTAQLLCETPEADGAPCGKCRNCHLVGERSHPDVTYVPTSGKRMSYSMEKVRGILSDAMIRPNNKSNRKIYIFSDCRSISNEVQNAMLKMIEEPPEYCCFIFTAESRYEFLPTILSRCVCFSVSACTLDEARECLEEGISSDKSEINAAIECFGGNIGMCTQYIVNETLRQKVDLTKRLADSIIRGDEYRLNADVYSIGSDRNDIHTVMAMLDSLVRDAAVLIEDNNARLIGCSREAAERLSLAITSGQAVRIHYAARDAWNAIERNVNIPFVMTTFCADIISIVS